MKRILFSLLTMLIASCISAQVSVYEFKDDKSYCTFEIDSQLAQDSVQIKGTYRAYQYYDIPYFEMTFVLHSYRNEAGQNIIVATPDFYYHSFRAKLIGQREPMNRKQFQLKFEWNDKTITPITTEENKNKLLKQSAYTEKADINFTQMPESFTKAKSIDWGKFPKDLRKALQDKDKTLGRKY